jgi:molybdopterin molybdotransferase
MSAPLPWQELARRLAALVSAPAAVELVPVRTAAGRVLAADAVAGRPIPAVSHAVMDGFALGSAPPGTYALVTPRPLALGPREACAIAAGEAIPAAAACVVLAEKAQADGGHLQVPRPQVKDNIRRAGEETAPGTIVLRARALLDGRHAALALAAGLSSLPVFRRPRVALLAVHDGPASLSHLPVMSALLRSSSLRLTEAGAARAASLPRELARLSAGHDLVVVVGESLGAAEGVLAEAIASAGGEVRSHKAALKPAKPVVSGRLGEAAIIGFAGTVYAVTAAAHLFLRPVLRIMAGLGPDDPFLTGTAAFARDREPGRAEMLPVRLHREGADLMATSAGRFGQLGALAALDGFGLIEAERGPLAPGAQLQCLPLRMPLI